METDQCGLRQNDFSTYSTLDNLEYLQQQWDEKEGTNR